jgi:hypothetical protein
LFVKNQLQSYPSSGEPDHNASKLLANMTNIHLHGLHVHETVLDDVVSPGMCPTRFA